MDSMRSAQPLSAATALIRGSWAAARRLIPAPYETPAMPMWAGSAPVLARAQSITLEASAMSLGPAVSISPPDCQKPREL